MARAVHTRQHDGVWRTEFVNDHEVRLISVHASRDRAVRSGATAARRARVSHVIHEADGRFARTVDYVPVPLPPGN